MLKTFTQIAWASLLCLLIINNLYAQKNYTRGYVVLPSGDTIQGLVDDQNWDRNPYFVNFKQTDSSDPQRYTVGQLAGFGLEAGDVYHQAVVQIDKTPTRFEQLLTSPKSVIITDTVFLLSQVNGRINSA
jgi:hypothetical protein